jgi:eukaryotic-like serine/threonine-protein kinase
MKRKTIAHYEILRRWAPAAAAWCTLANDTLLQRPVVLKMLHTGLLTAEQMRSTVLREARLASAIEHPNVCAFTKWARAATRLTSPCSLCPASRWTS